MIAAGVLWYGMSEASFLTGVESRMEMKEKVKHGRIVLAKGCVVKIVNEGDNTSVNGHQIEGRGG